MDFESSEDVANAIRKLDGTELKGKQVKLSDDPVRPPYVPYLLCSRMPPSTLLRVANVLAVPTVEEDTVVVVGDTTNVVDLLRPLFEEGMVEEVILIVLLHDILLLRIESILLFPEEMMGTHRVGEQIMSRRGGLVRDMMTVLRGDHLWTLEGKGRTMEGVIGELSFFRTAG